MESDDLEDDNEDESRRVITTNEMQQADIAQENSNAMCDINNVKGFVPGSISTRCRLFADLNPIYPGALQYFPLSRVSQYPPRKIIVIYGNV